MTELTKASKYIMGMDAALCDESTDKSRCKFIECVKDITLTANDKMLSFTYEIIHQSMQMLSTQPPCDFNVIAIGSLARGDATPYSDLEYMFLIEKRTAETEMFFHQLAMTTYFIIGNLQETTLGCMDIEELKGWFDDKAKSGFKIDGLTEESGNIPTGNSYGSTASSYILTPKELLAKYSHVLDNPDSRESVRGDFTAMRTYQTSVYTYGNKIKLDNIQTKISSLVQNEKRREANYKMLLTDISKFNFNVDTNLKWNGYTMDVKKQLFRFPSVLVMDLAIIYKCAGKTSSDTIKNLFKCRHISKSAKSCLEFLLATACFIRLSAYLFHDSQDHRVSVARQKDVDETPPGKKRKSSPPKSPNRRWYIPYRLFTNICMHMVPLKHRLSNSNAPSVINELQSFTTKDSHWSEVVQIHHFSGRYKEAYLKLRNSLKDLHITPDDVIQQTMINVPEAQPQKNAHTKTVLTVIADLLLRCANYSSALNFYEYMHRNRYTQCQFAIAECHVKSAIRLGGHQLAAEESLVRLNPVTTEDHYIVGWLHSFNPRNLAAAESHLVKSMQISHHLASTGKKKHLPGESPFVLLENKTPLQRLDYIVNIDANIIDCLMVLGDIYKQKNALQNARAYYRKSCEAISQFYGDDAVVPSVAHIKRRRGVMYEEIAGSDDERGIQYVRQALQIFEEIYDTNHEYVQQARQERDKIQKRHKD